MCSCYTEHLATYSKVPSSKKAVIFHGTFLLILRVIFLKPISQVAVVAHLLEQTELTAIVKVAIDCRDSSEMFPK